MTSEASEKSRFQLKFSNSSPALLPPEENATHLSGQALLQSRSAAALRLHYTRLAGFSERLTLCFLLFLGLLLAWLIGHFQASPALLVLLAVAALALGKGRWQQVVEGAELEAELKVRKQQQTQIRGETVEWLNFLINRWWATCNKTVLEFAKEYVEPLVADLLPPGIDHLEVVEIDFGEQTPVVSNMRVLDLPTAKGMAADVGSPPTCTVVVNFDLTIPSPESHIVLRARVGGKSVNCGHLVYVESLYVSGTLQAIVVLGNHAPFPNLLRITATFINKPDIWFSVRVMKGLNVTNIPLLKSLVHSMVMDMVTTRTYVCVRRLTRCFYSTNLTVLVDPGKLTLNFGPFSSPDDMSEEVSCAVGVATITVTATPIKSRENSSKGGVSHARCLTLRLGKKKYEQQLSIQGGVCRGTYSYLVSNLQHDMVVLKVKLRRIVRSMTLAVHTVGLKSLGLDSGQGSEERIISFSNSEASFSLCLNYTPLPTFSLHAINAFPPVQKDSVSGVLYVHVHRAQDLLGCDSNGLSDPYCIVQANKQKILRTPHINNTLTPCWERGAEVFVTDITQVVLTFAVLDWDGPLVDDSLLGVAKFSLPEGYSEVVQQKLTLQMDNSVKLTSKQNSSRSSSRSSIHSKLSSRRGSKADSKQDLSLGTLTVSVLFRPVASVGKSSPKCHVTSIGGTGHLPWDAGSVVSGMDGYNSKRKFFKNRPTQYLQQGKAVLELQLFKGHDLVPKDSNGLSDPYILVKYGSKIVFRSKVIKKCLNPEWNQRVTLTAPSTDDIIYVECWDKDVFSDDFMGSMQFTDRDLQIFREKEQWCKLEHVQHGQVLLRLCVSEEDTSKWSHLDEASRQLVGEVTMCEGEGVEGTIVMRSQSDGSLSSSSSTHSSNIHEDSSDTSHVIQHPSSVPELLPCDKAGTHTPSKSSAASSRPSSSSAAIASHTPSIVSSSSEGAVHPPLRRRHTLSHHSPEHNVPLIPRYPETRADIQWALNRAAADGGLGSKPHTIDRYKEKQITVFHNVSGQVMEASGLKGELDHMELYVKVRLNTRPSYQRQHKFGRGPVVHKTRVLRGSRNPQWREDFMVKESPVPSDSLLTLDLKSGSKVNIGTYAVTLDKFFDGNLKATRYYDIGNNVKLRVKLSRQMR